jgi:hypothetical protein
MRGGFCHNEILTRRLRRVAEECHAVVTTEAPVRIDDTVCYADLVIEKNGAITVCELEDCCRRVRADLRKATALRALLLLIATPDALTAHACRRQLRRCPDSDSALKVIICPLGAAVEILRATLTAGDPKPGSSTGQGKET